ncbi:MAG TPA: OsmC family protein [Bacteroidales bacterium]|nr:OsmC family protein [Bacteroidales bacterium]
MMLISATLSNIYKENEVTVSTGDSKKKIIIPSKPLGKGSSVNGGELLFLALATCYCNDLYREAERRDMDINGVEVTVKGEFGSDGEPASNVTYEVKAQSSTSSPQEIADLIRYVDCIAEVHNTLRKGTTVTLRLQEPAQGVEVKKVF